MGCSLDGLEARVDVAAGKSQSPGVSAIKVGLGTAEFTWKAPAAFPRDPAWNHRLVEVEGIAGGVGRLRLAIAGLPEGKHSLYEGDRLIGAATAEEWKKGVDLTKWSKFSTNERTAELWDQIQKRQRILGLAWLTDIGHKRPDTRKGIPLADALKYGSEIDAKVNELLKAPDLHLRITGK
jgi:hypothetical protein